MNNFRKTLFAVALSAIAGAALAAPPATTPATSGAPAKTTVTKHKHLAKARKDDAKSSTKAPASNDAKKS